MGIGATLQHLIDLRGTNVNAVSVATGVNPQTLYSIIKRDSTKVNIDDLYKIAAHLGVDLNFFYRNYSLEQEKDPDSLSGAGVEKTAIMLSNKLCERDYELVRMLIELSPAESARVRDFVAGILAAREDAPFLRE